MRDPGTGQRGIGDKRVELNLTVPMDDGIHVQLGGKIEAEPLAGVQNQFDATGGIDRALHGRRAATDIQHCIVA